MNTHLITGLFNCRTLGLVLFYSLVCAITYWTAYELRFDFDVPEEYHLGRIRSIGWVVALQIGVLFPFRQFNCILSYFRLPDAQRLFLGLLTNSLLLLGLRYFYENNHYPPRSVILIYFLLNFLLLGGFRILMRVKSAGGIGSWFSPDTRENAIILGAGNVGTSLCVDLFNKSKIGIRPVAFLDDDPKKNHRYVHGIRVAGKVNQMEAVAKKYNASKVIIAFPSAPSEILRKVAKLAQKAELGVDMVPSLDDLLSKRAIPSQLHSIRIEDLLGRDAINLHSDELLNMLQGKRVMITGAGGSIGRELVSQVLKYSVAQVHCIDQTEIAIFNLQQEVLPKSKASSAVSVQVLDIINTKELDHTFSKFLPEVVFHAAAHKHVGLMEHQPEEALRNNFLATKTLADLSGQYKSERFILISTDKAINPTSVMGASKRLAEMAVTEKQKSNTNNATKFMAVRFGNVLGSSGSVIPIFRRQIEAGGPVTVTHPEVTRFFMTVKEAVGLVLQSAAQGSGGEIFVLDMGESVKILELAKQIIALSGLKEGVDIHIEFTGLKPGEKLYEEVQHRSEEVKSTKHPQIMRFVPDKTSSVEIQDVCRIFEDSIYKSSPDELKALIKQFVPEYTPYGL